MRIAILTIFPEMFESVLHSSILGRAREEKLVEIEPVDIRPFSDRKHKNTDDYPFGGGAGMVMLAQPICDAVRHLRAQGYTGKCIYMSPRGKTFTQQKVMELAQEENFILLCGHYEGVDQRALDLCIDEELSIGDAEEAVAAMRAQMSAPATMSPEDYELLFETVAAMQRELTARKRAHAESAASSR